MFSIRNASEVVSDTDLQYMLAERKKITGLWSLNPKPKALNFPHVCLFYAIGSEKSHALLISSSVMELKFSITLTQQ